MKDFKRSKAILITLFICAVLMCAGWIIAQKWSISTLKPDQFVQDKEALSRLLENSSEIQRIWSEGEDSREWISLKKECLSYYQITETFDESLLRCNPMIFECLNRFNQKLNFRFVKPDLSDDQNQKIYRYLTKSNTSHIGLEHSGYLFTIEDKKNRKHLNLFLADQCHEVFLQNRTYAYGEEILEKKSSEETEDYRFDNFNQNIYIDQHLVMNSELNEWIDFGNPNFTEGLKKSDNKDYFLPATSLTYSQMENYCSFKGKQLMQAHIFDAATFLPMDLNDINPKNNNRSPYYWTKKKSEFKSDCSLIFAKECLQKKNFKINSTSPTWAGLTDSMGGPFEVFRNPIDPESNLKAASYYFNFKSPWHKLGFRASWDGEDFDLRHFDFKGINPEIIPQKFQVGFRCMREEK